MYLIESWICSLLVCHIHLLPSPAVLLNDFANLLIFLYPLCPLGKWLPRNIPRKQLEAGSAPVYLLGVKETVVTLKNGDHSEELLSSVGKLLNIEAKALHNKRQGRQRALPCVLLFSMRVERGCILHRLHPGSDVFLCAKAIQITQCNNRNELP